MVRLQSTKSRKPSYFFRFFYPKI